MKINDLIKESASATPLMVKDIDVFYWFRINKGD